MGLHLFKLLHKKVRGWSNSRKFIHNNLKLWQTNKFTNPLILTWMTYAKVTWHVTAQKFRAKTAAVYAYSPFETKELMSVVISFNKKPIPTETICDLRRIILTMKNFTFNSHHHLKKLGTVMGSRMAPSHNNLFLGKFEHDALLRAPYHDAIFMIWTKSLGKLELFVDYLNNSLHYKVYMITLI